MTSRGIAQSAEHNRGSQGGRSLSPEWWNKVSAASLYAVSFNGRCRVVDDASLYAVSFNGRCRVVDDEYSHESTFLLHIENYENSTLNSSPDKSVREKGRAKVSDE